MRFLVTIVITITTLTLSAQNYFLNGNAFSLGGDCYQLTDVWNDQNGTVWYADQIDLNQPFDITFFMNLGANDDNGADGICFVLQTIGTNALGQSGGGMGYQTFSTSLGVEFDTWSNADSFDPTYDHIAIEKNGIVNHNSPENLAGPVQMDAFSINTEDNTNHVVRITWDPITLNIKVYFDCVFRLQATVDIVNTIFSGQSLVYWGFTAATGGAVNAQKVCLQPSIIASPSQVQTCPGTGIQLSAGASLNGQYTWSPALGLSSTTIVNPIATPSQTTTYTVSYTNLCGIVQTNTIEVIVDEINLDLPASVTLNCADTVAHVTANLNFPGINYLWSTTDGQILGSSSTSNLNTDQTGEYILNVNFQNQCFDTDTVLVTSDYSDFQVSVVYDSILTCINDALSLFATTSIGGSSFIWTTNTGNFVNSPTNSTAIVNAPGDYTVQAVLNSHCNDTFDLSISSNQVLPIIFASNDDTLNCFQPEIIIDATTNVTNPMIQWSATNGGQIVGNTNTSSVLAVEDGLYQVEVTDPTNGCSSIEEVVLSIDTLAPNLVFFPSDTISCKHPLVVLNNYTVSPPITLNYTWSFLGSWPFINSHEATPSVNLAGVYILEVQNTLNGCIDTASVEVTMNDNVHFDVTALEFPNILTANEDSLNNVFRPFVSYAQDEDVLPYFSYYQLSIFNRWGEHLFTSSEIEPYWHPKDLSLGTYFYTLLYETTCGTNEKGEVSGAIELVH
jgi:hypothetical protein